MGQTSTSERREIAREYIENGWTPIPVPPGTKEPVLKDWPNKKITVDDVPKYWTNGQNIGVITGEASGWLVVFDLDQPEAMLVAPHILPETRTSGRKSEKDSHYLFNATSPVKSRRFDIDMPDDEEEYPMLELTSRLPPRGITCSGCGRRISENQPDLVLRKLDAGTFLPRYYRQRPGCTSSMQQFMMSSPTEVWRITHRGIDPEVN